MKHPSWLAIGFIALATAVPRGQGPVVETLEDRDHVAVMGYGGIYDRQAEGNREFEVRVRQAVAREFFRTHADDYDFLVVFTRFRFAMNLPGENVRGRHYAVRNDTQGIGLEPFDNSAAYGSSGRLQSYIDMGPLPDLVTDPTDPAFEGTLSVLAHELAHRWGAYVRFSDGSGTPNEALLGRDKAHWSFLLQSHNSVLYGNDWRDNGDGTFTSVGRAQSFYSPLELYLMGMLPPEQVPPFFVIDSPGIDVTRLPEVGVTVPGVARPVTIDDVIEVEGPRVPAAADAQKRFKIGFILLLRPGGEAEGLDLRRVNTIREAFSTRALILTSGRGIVEVYPDRPDTPPSPTPIVPPSSGPRPGPVDLVQGIDWLLARQHTDGAWADADATQVRDTAAVLDLLKEIPSAFDPYQHGLAWLASLQEHSNVDTASRRLVAVAPQFSAPDAAFLAEARNADGGWGLSRGYRSDVFDTALALMALPQGPPDAAIAFLLANQNADGGWPLRPNGASSIQATAAVLRLAGRYPTAPLVAAVANARLWLQTRQQVDGGFGDAASTVYDTAQAVLALVGTEFPRESLNHGLAFLQAAQLADGSWNESSYQTALAVRALKIGALPNVTAGPPSFTPAAPVEGDAVTISAQVVNDSAVDLNGVVVRVFDGDPAAGGARIGGDIVVPALPALSERSVSIAWDTEGRPGDHTIVVVVDPDGTIDEFNEADNQASAPVVVRLPPEEADLVVRAADLALAPALLQSVPQAQALTVTVRNAGRTPAVQAGVQVFDGDPAAGGVLLGGQAIDVAARGASAAAFQFDVTSSREHRYFVVLDPLDQVIEADEGNNRAFAPLPVQSTLDFVPSDVTFSQNPIPIGSTLTITAQVGNRGTSGAFAVPVRFVVEHPDGPIELGTLGVDLGSGESRAISTTWRTARALDDVPLAVIVDPENTKPESNEENNRAASPLTVQPSADANLSVRHADLQISAPVLQSGSATISVTVRNTGAADAANVGVAFFLGVPANGGVPIGAMQIVPLIAAGGQAVVLLQWEQIAVNGQRLIYVAVDEANAIPEFDEEDNTAFVTVDVRALPDLAITRGALSITPAFPKPGDAVSMAVVVSNIGQQPAPNVRVRFIDGAAGGGVIVGEQVLADVPPGGSGAVQMLLPGAAEAGSRTISAVVDPLGEITELLEDNNAASRTLGVQDASLWFSNLYFSPNGDGLQDDTDVFFRFGDGRAASRVSARNTRGDEVRLFTLDTAASSGSVTWDGRDASGRLVPDGEYTFAPQGADGSALGSATVIVDNNASPLGDAFGTKYMLQGNLTCTLAGSVGVDRFGPTRIDYQTAGWLPDDSGLVKYFETQAVCSQAGPSFQNPCGRYTFVASPVSGVYVIGPDGVSTRVTPDSWGVVPPAGAGTRIVRVDISPDGSKLLITVTRYQSTAPNFASIQLLSPREYWVVNSDGSGLTLAGTIPVNALNNSNAFEFRPQSAWAPDNRRFVVRAWDSVLGQYRVHLMRADAGANTPVDTVPFEPSFSWSPDSARVFYTRNQAVYSMAGDGSGSPRQEFASDPFTLLGDPTTWLWMAPDRFLTTGYVQGSTERRLTMFSTAGAAPVQIAAAAGFEGPVASPDGSTFAYAESAPSFSNDTPERVSTGIHLVDAAGVSRRVYTAAERNRGVTKIRWSRDGQRLVFLEEVTTEHKVCSGDGSYFCGTSYLTLAGVNLRDEDVRSFPVTEPTVQHQVGPRFALEPLTHFPDGESYLFQQMNGNQRTEDVVAVSAVDGSRATTSLGASPDFTNAAFSPSGRYFLYRRYNVDALDVCWKGYTGTDDWVLSSLLNLTTQVTFQRDGSQLNVRGIAEDRHFATYALEYAPVATPDAWSPIAAPSDVSAINEVLARWIPPAEGSFHVRLTAADKAGNRLVARRRVTWGLAPSITNVVLRPRIFSPNGDGVHDAVTIDYVVIGPVNLAFEILDAGDVVVRTILQEHDTIGPASIAWDGRDEAGQFVADGVYRIHVLDYDFFATVDRTPPDVRAALGGAFHIDHVFLPRPRNLVAAPYHVVTGRAVDGNLARWTLESGVGQAPPEWQFVAEGSESLLKEDQRGVPIAPPQDTQIERLEDLDAVAGRRFRVVAEDRAGNRTVVLSGFSPNEIVLYAWDGQEIPADEVIDTRREPHVLSAAHTSRTSLESVRVQYRLQGTAPWIDGPALATPGRRFGFPWDNTPLQAGRTYDVRLAGTDADGGAVVSNVIAIHSDLFEMTGSQFGAAAGVASVREAELVVRLVEALPGEREIGDYAATITTEVTFEIPIAVDLTNHACTGREVPARFKGVGSSGRVYYSNVLAVIRPPNPPGGSCDVTGDPRSALGLRVVTQPAAVCGPSPERVEISLVLPVGPHNVLPGSATLAIQDVPNGLLRDVPLPALPFAMQLDTSTRPVGTYLVRATWQAVGASGASSVVETFVVDRTPPIGQITYPAANQAVCPVRSGSRLTIPIEGRADDANFDHYELQYGFGDDPATWTPFFPTPLEYPDSRVPKTGVLANLDVSALPGGVYTVRLKVYDKGGNLTCHVVTFTVQTVVRIDGLTADNGLFSPNGDGRRDGVTFSYAVNRTASVTARIHAVQGGQPADSPLRTIFANAQQLEGSNSVAWDGLSDLGGRVPDGEYMLVLTATDACGSVATQTRRVRVDVTLPEAALTSPEPASEVGVVVDARGIATDLHFERYILEVGTGAAPDAWTTLASGFAPVDGDMLGTWNNGGRQGTYTLRLTARDAAGNERETHITVEVPDEPPLITSLSVEPALFSPNADGRLDTSVVAIEVGADAQVVIDVVDAGGTLVKRLREGNALTGATYRYVWDGSTSAGQPAPDGDYVARLSATSAADPNRMQTEQTTVRIDTARPIIALDGPAGGSHLRGDIAVAGSITDATLDTYALVHDAAPGGATQTLDEGRQNRSAHQFGLLQGLSDGVYTLRVSAVDRAENRSEQVVTFTADNTPPAATLLAPEPGALVGGNAAALAVRGAVDEHNINQWTLRIGSGLDPPAWTEVASGATLPIGDPAASIAPGSLADGDHTLSLLATDRAGSTGEARRTFVVDRTPPVAVIVSPLEGARLTEGAPILGDASDAHFKAATVEIGEGSAATASRFSPVATLAAPVSGGTLATLQAPSPDGVYTLRLVVEDELGQRATALRTIRIDTQPPPPPIGLTATVEHRSAARLHWDASPDPEIAGYHVYRNGARLTGVLTAATTWLDANPGDGVHRYTVSAVDLAGLESERSDEASVQIDLTAPATTLLAPAGGAVVSGLLDIRGTASATDDFKEYRVLVSREGGPFTLVRQSPQPIIAGVLTQYDTFALPENSALAIRLEAEDLSGNVASDQVAVTIDNSPPAAPVLVSAAANISDITAQWQANSEADLAGYLLYNGDVLANARRIVTGTLAPYIITGTSYVDRALVDGTHTYVLFAIDRAGNISSPSETRTVDLDTRAPRATIVQPTNNSRTEHPVLIVATVVDQDVAHVQFQFKAAAEPAWTDLGGPDATAPYSVAWDPAALAHGSYQFRAVATDTHAQTDAAPPFITIVLQDLTPPDPPNALTAVVTEASVALSWPAGAEPNLAYHVYRQQGAQGPLRVTPAPIAAVAYVDASVPDATYAYTVRVLDGAGNEGAPSPAAPARVYRPVLTAPFCTDERNVDIAGTGATPFSQVTLFIDTGQGPSPFGAAMADDTGAFSFAAVPLDADQVAFTAQATDAAGNVSRRAAALNVSFVPEPEAPPGFAASVNGFDVSLSWNPPPGAFFRYNVYRGGLPIMPAGGPHIGGAASASSNAQPATNAVDNGPNTFWRPLPDDASPVWRIDFAQPAVVRQVQLDWLSPNQAADFDLERLDGPAWVRVFQVRNNGSFRQTLTLPQPIETTALRIVITRAVGGLAQLRLAEVRVQRPFPLFNTALTDVGAPNGRHTYAVRALTFCGLEGPPAELEVAVGDVTPPAAVTGLTAAAAGSDVTLEWNASAEPDLDGYVVYRNDGGGWLPLNITPIDDVTFLDAQPNGDYTYRVTAVDQVGNESDPSNEAAVTLNVPLPPAPATLAVAAPGAGSALDITWSSGGGGPAAAGYRLTRALVAGGPYEPIGPLMMSESYRDTGLANGVTYFYVVRAADAAGNLSAPSNEGSGTPADRLAPDAPVLRHPTTAATPITVAAGQTPVGGSAEPGSLVTLLQGGLGLGTATAQPASMLETSALPIAFNTTQAFHRAGLVAGNLVTAGFPQGVLGVRDLATGETTFYTSIRAIDHPAFSADARFIAYTTMEAGGYRLRIFDRSTASVVHSYDVGAQPRDVSFSPDGATLAYSQGGFGGSVWTLDIATGARTGRGQYFNVPFIPVWSPAGQHLAFRSMALHILAVATGIVRTVSETAPFQPVTFSPGGTTLVYAEADGLFAYDVASGVSTPLPAAGSMPSSPAWSPDGARLAYLATPPGGARSLYLRDMSTGESSVLLEGVSNLAPHWSLDQSLVQLAGAQVHTTLLPGRFWFDDVLLAPGLNVFSAIATDAAGNTSLPADPLAVTRDVSTLPDLAVEQSDLFVHPVFPQPGEPVEISVDVRNIGAAAASNVSVVFLAVSEAGSAVVIGQAQVIPALAAGASATASVTWDTSGLAGPYRLSAIVDHADTIEEASEANNRAARDSRVSPGGAPAIAVRTDRAMYAADGVVQVTVDAVNPGASSDFVLDVRIEDEAGFVAATLLHDTLPAFGSSSRTVQAQWPAAGVFGGVYRAHAVLTPLQGPAVEAAAAFAVQADETARASLTTDRATYRAGDLVQVRARVENTSANAVLADAAVLLQILDARGREVFRHLQHPGMMLPGDAIEITREWPSSAPGAYSARLSLQSIAGELASASAPFGVDGRERLEGHLAVSPSIVAAGEPLIADARVVNTGTLDIAAWTLRLLVVDAVTQATVDVHERPLDVGAGAETAWQVTIPTASLPRRAYSLLLLAQGPVDTQALATTAATVADREAPAVTILSPAADAFFKEAVRVAVRALDDSSGVAGVELQVDEGPWTRMTLADPATGRYTHSYPATPATEGPRTLRVRAIDHAGNDDTTSSADPNPSSVAIVIDVTAPAIDITGVEDGATYHDPVVPMVTVADANLSTQQVTLDGVPFVSGSTVAAPGPHLLEVRAEDAAGNPSARAVSFSVADVNRPPVADDMAVTTDEDSPVEIHLNATDPDDDPLMFVVSAPSNGVLSGTAPDLVYTPNADFFGADAFTFSAGDGSATTPARTVTISVTPINDRPIAHAGSDQNVDEQHFVRLDGSASSDVEQDPLTFSWEQVSGPQVYLSLGDPARPIFVTPAVPADGEVLTFKLVVSDGTDESAASLVNVHVKSVNHPPVADAGAPQEVAVGDVVMLDGSASYDPDGDAIAFHWTQIAGEPVGAGGLDTAHPIFTAPFVAVSTVLRFELRVTDGVADTIATVDVTVIPAGNRPPVADAGPDKPAREGRVVILDGRASSDPDGDPLRFQWTQTSGTPVQLSRATTAKPFFTAPNVTAHGDTLTFSLVVNDGFVDSVPDSVTVPVIDPSSGPVCSAAVVTPSVLWPPDHRLVTVQISGLAAGDAEPGDITLRIDRVTQDEPTTGTGDGDTGPDAFVANNVVSLRAERAGGGNGRVYRIKFTAKTPDGQSCAGAVFVQVPHAPNAPAVDDGQNHTATSVPYGKKK